MSRILNVLCVGDVVGSPGRQVLIRHLKQVQQAHHIHFTVVNIENASGGFGITMKSYKELDPLDIQVMTSGNHIYDKKEIIELFSMMPKLIRPLNFPVGAAGIGVKICNFNEVKIGVINLMGRVFMPPLDCPFQTVKRCLDEVLKQTNIVIVDFHAEATSEKHAMGWFLDGKVSCVFGTHTHVQSADARILEKGTAYITDVGMVGSINGILGMEKEAILQKFLVQMPVKFQVLKSGPVGFHALKISIDTATGKAVAIERLQQEYLV